MLLAKNLLGTTAANEAGVHTTGGSGALRIHRDGVVARNVKDIVADRAGRGKRREGQDDGHP